MIHMPKGSRETPILSKQELLIMVNGLVASETATVSSNGQMVHNTLVSGKITEPMVKASSLILTEMSMKEIGLMIRAMAMESIIILMVQCMRATGETIFSMDLEKKAGPMARFMKESTMLERNMASDFITGMMDLSIMESGMRIRSRDLEHIAG